MTTFKEHDGCRGRMPRETGEHADDAGKLTLAEVLEIFAGGRLPLRFTAYDGSSAGPADAPFGLDLKTPRGTTYLATGFGDLGLARAYIAGDLDIQGVHPGDPYELLKALAESLEFARPPARVMAQIVRSIGFEHLRPIAPPPQEVPPRWRRVAGGLRHSKTPRRRGDPPPLRRLEHLLRVGARAVDDLHLRVLSEPRMPRSTRRRRTSTGSSSRSCG